jgi:hypothetical protein
MNLIRVLTSCWMAIRFSMSISRLIIMSRLPSRYLSRRTGFEGNGTFQSHFFSLLKFTYPRARRHVLDVGRFFFENSMFAMIAICQLILSNPMSPSSHV